MRLLMARLSYTLAMPTRKPKGKTAEGEEDRGPRRAGRRKAPALGRSARGPSRAPFPGHLRIVCACPHTRRRAARDRRSSGCSSATRTNSAMFGVPISNRKRWSATSGRWSRTSCDRPISTSPSCAPCTTRGTAAKNDQFGYRASADLTFEPDELGRGVRGRRARARPRRSDADAESAMRKLATTSLWMARRRR